MTIYTGAQDTALELFQTRNPKALHVYLERWRSGIEKVPPEYVLAVIEYYNSLTNDADMPDVDIGPLRINRSSQRVFWKGQDADLTMTEFRVVKLFVDNIGDWLTYRKVYDVVHYSGFTAGWGCEGYRTNVRSIIKRMRRKFMIIDPAWNMIENYSGYGYRWVKPEMPVIVTPIAGVAVTTDAPAPVISAK
jgi:DNA-binding response OmpR family regulator